VSPFETWFLFESGAGGAARNMATDHALLEEIGHLGGPVLRFYGWTEPAATFGYSQCYEDIERATPLRPLIRRPTGGGLVPHDRDWTYSLVLPAGHWWYRLAAVESYRLVHAWLKAGFEVLGVSTELAPCGRQETPGQCFAGHERHDLLWHGRKIAGAAQRRTRTGLLIQGSVQAPPGADRVEWEAAVRRSAQSRPDPAWLRPVAWAPFAASREFHSRVDRLIEDRYAQASHNTRR
jgi:lipoate-protein ligase A